MTAGRWLISISLLAVTFVYLQFFTASEAVPIRKPLESFPNVIGAWRGAEYEVLDDDSLAILKASDYVVRRYVDPIGRSLWLYIGYWETQRKGAQIHSPKNCLPGGGWEPLETARLKIRVGAAENEIEANRFVLQKGPDRQVVIYWFQSQGRAIAGETEARIALVKNAIAHNRSDGAIVRVSSPVFGNVSDTSRWLTEYVQSMYPALREFLPD
jgi:EpsI family protein